jgi:hypothetical protein
MNVRRVMRAIASDRSGAAAWAVGDGGVVDAWRTSVRGG